jgi:hypothetical protein
MRVKVKMPGGAATDARYSVTFYDESVAFPLTFHFLLVGDPDRGVVEQMRNIGCEFGEAPPSNDEEALAIPELTMLSLRRVIERYPHWVALARQQLAFEEERKGDLAAGVKRPKPARLDRDWYRMVAAEYRHHQEAGEPAPVSAIARSHQVTVSAASRWVKGARERGFMSES